MKQNIQKVIIGVDVSKEKLDIWDSAESEHYVLKNDKRIIGQWFKARMEKYDGLQLLLEPTGGYEKQLAQQCLGYGLDVYLVHPNHFHHYKKAIGCNAKTDKLDCQLLAKYLGEEHKRVKQLTDEYTENEELVELSVRRKQIKALIHTETCRKGHKHSNKQVKKSTKQLIAFLRKDLKKIDEAIDKFFLDNEVCQKKVALLQTVKGVGRVTSQTLVIDMPELGRLTNTQISRLLGVAPINRDSGKKNGQRFISGGRGDIRRVVYMAALVAIKHNQEMKQYYERLKARGKVFKVALVAVMRKLICILNCMLRDNQPYLSKSELEVERKVMANA